MSNNKRTIGEIFISKDKRPDLDIDLEKPVSDLTPGELSALNDATFRNPKWKEAAKETPEKYFADVGRELVRRLRNPIDKYYQDHKRSARDVAGVKDDWSKHEDWAKDVLSVKDKVTAIDGLVERVTELSRKVEGLEQKLH